MDAAIAKSLGTTLGIEEAKVATALTDIRAAEHAKRAAAMKTRLDKSVTVGTLTQAEADAVTEAWERGVIGGRWHRPQHGQYCDMTQLTPRGVVPGEGLA